FSRAAGDGVLHAVTGEHLQLSVVHVYRNVNDDLAVGLAKNAPETIIEFELLGCQVKAGSLLFPRIAFLFERMCRGSHRFLRMIAIAPRATTGGCRGAGRGRLASRLGG